MYTRLYRIDVLQTNKTTDKITRCDVLEKEMKQ